MGNSPLLQGGLKWANDYCMLDRPSPTDLFQSACSRWKLCWCKVGQTCIPQITRNPDLQVCSRSLMIRTIPWQLITILNWVREYGKDRRLVWENIDSKGSFSWRVLAVKTRQTYWLVCEMKHAESNTRLKLPLVRSHEWRKWFSHGSFRV